MSKHHGQVPEERRLVILQRLRDTGLLRADELTEALQVSAETIRRDFITLEREGHLRRVYGGAARLVHPRSLEPSFTQRQIKNLNRKRAMAVKAVTLVEDNDTLIFDVGTSVAQVARQFPLLFRGRVLTNSLRVAMELESRAGDGLELLVAGGRMRPGDMALSGHDTDAFYQAFFADKAFLGSGGVHYRNGLTDFHIEEVSARKIMLKSAREKYVLADSTKLGVTAVAKVCDLGEITGIITDDGVEDSVRREFDHAGIQLIIAAVNEGDGVMDPSSQSDIGVHSDVFRGGNEGAL